jgi:hypothetical protein
MGLKHKHAELIKQWADGAEIEYLNVGSNSVWSQVDSPRWDEHGDYRIKPEPKPDVVEQYVAKGYTKYGCVRVAEHWEKENLKLTFDGETGKLKSAEVL